MNKKNLFFSLFILVALFFIYDQNKSEKSTPQITKSFSVVKKAKVVKAPSSNLGILNQINRVDNSVQETSNKLKRKYLSFRTQGQKEISSRLSSIEEDYKKLNEFLYDNNIKIDPIFTIKPRFLIAMALHLDINLSDLTVEDIRSRGLKNAEIFKIKTFSESEDFRILLKRGELSPERLQLDNL